MDSSSAVLISRTRFWNCVSILLRNYHAINRKIFACIVQSTAKILPSDTNTHPTHEPCNELELNKVLKNLSQDEDYICDCQGFLLKMKYLNKKAQQDIEANVYIDVNTNSFACKFIDCMKLDDYEIKLEHFGKIAINILTQRLDVEVTNRWAEYVLRPKLIKWSQSNSADADEHCSKEHKSSLELIDLEAYNSLYKILKAKHAAKLQQMWVDVGESTDPLKFIYEDLAIATYLITLWTQNGYYGNLTPTAFADLGCGNGLLVYILNEEGFKGYGYDLRSRKLWGLYPTGIQLIEQAIDPLMFKLPTDVDWLIGNHSDELSPWIAVLAANSSYKMRYFLLPCCAYEFSGSKFRRRNTSLSVYQDFMDYAMEISQKCGFQTLEDRLKIPSTKRKALIGIQRNYSESEFGVQCTRVAQFVAEERVCHGLSKQDSNEIKMRNKEEPVRNCTQIDSNIISSLTLQIFNVLLPNAAEARKSIGEWRQGRRLRLQELAQSLSSADRKQIKAECGGLKTLLRNKHEVFEFCGNDLVGIRKPRIRDYNNRNKPQTVKKRLCFFKLNHPQGCPLSDEQCTFVH